MANCMDSKAHKHRQLLSVSGNGELETPRLGGQNLFLSGSNYNETQERSTHEQGRIRSSNVSTEVSIEFLVRMLWDKVEKFWLQMKAVPNFVMIEMGGYQLIDKLTQWSIRHPIIAVCMLGGIIAFMMPFLILLGIGLATILMTLTGFLVIEGSLLTALSLLIFGFLGAASIILFFFVMVMVAICFGLGHILGLYGGSERLKGIFAEVMFNGSLRQIISLVTRQNTHTESEEINIH